VVVTLAQGTVRFNVKTRDLLARMYALGLRVTAGAEMKWAVVKKIEGSNVRRKWRKK
jgi:hypothetical protein